jgi:hypothetical protein
MIHPNIIRRHIKSSKEDSKEKLMKISILHKDERNLMVKLNLLRHISITNKESIYLLHNTEKELKEVRKKIILMYKNL